MTTRILTEMAASISELKANPMKVALSAGGDSIAVLNRNEPVFYCVPANTYELLMDRIEDLELIALAESRNNEDSIKVDINDL